MKRSKLGKTVRPWMVGLAVCTCFVMLSTGLYSMANTAAPDTLKITKYTKKKPDVPFPHKKHVDAKISCQKCHHKTEAGKKPGKCTDCHLDKMEGDGVDAKKAFHKSCTKCHRKAKKAGGPTGPTKCNDCHSG